MQRTPKGVDEATASYKLTKRIPGLRQGDRVLSKPVEVVLIVDSDRKYKASLTSKNYYESIVSVVYVQSVWLLLCGSGARCVCVGYV